MAFAIQLVEYPVMRKELAVISVGIAIAASVLYAELKPASNTPVQVTSVSNSATPQPAQPLQPSQATQKMTPKTATVVTQNVSSVVAVKPTINQSGGGETDDGEEND